MIKNRGLLTGSTKKVITNSEKETKEFAAKFALEILNKKSEGGAVVLALKGNLGAGKTTFLQGFAKGLGIKEKILSPTFVILKKFKITSRRRQKAGDKKFDNFYHIDCYRLKGPKEVLDLGFKEIISDSQNIVAVEWAERLRGILPKNIILIKLDYNAENTRILTIEKY